MAIALLVHAIGPGGADGCDTTSTPIDSTGATLGIIATTYYNFSDPTVGDSKSNTWHALTEHQVGFSAGTRIFWSALTSVGSGHTFSVSGASSYSNLIVACFSGSAASPFDLENGNDVTPGTTLKPGSLTPSENNELLVTSLSWQSGTTASIDAGFAITDQLDFSVGGSLGGGLAYLIQTAASASDPQWTMSISTNAASSMATFKASGASPGDGAVLGWVASYPTVPTSGY